MQTMPGAIFKMLLAAAADGDEPIPGSRTLLGLAEKVSAMQCTVLFAVGDLPTILSSLLPTLLSTVLSVVMQKGRPELVRALLEAGADPNEPTPECYTPCVLV